MRTKLPDTSLCDDGRFVPAPRLSWGRNEPVEFMVSGY